MLPVSCRELNCHSERPNVDPGWEPWYPGRTEPQSGRGAENTQVVSIPCLEFHSFVLTRIPSLAGFCCVLQTASQVRSLCSDLRQGQVDSCSVSRSLLSHPASILPLTMQVKHFRPSNYCEVAMCGHGMTPRGLQATYKLYETGQIVQPL